MNGDKKAVNPEDIGTKAAAHYELTYWTETVEGDPAAPDEDKSCNDVSKVVSPA